MLEADDAVDLSHVDLQRVLAAAQAAAGQLLDLLEDCGKYVQRCRRLRQRIPGDVMSDMGDLLDWYVVLFTVGMVDRQGVWLAEDPWRNAPGRSGPARPR